jgi:hypothetical protein
MDDKGDWLEWSSLSGADAEGTTSIAVARQDASMSCVMRGLGAGTRIGHSLSVIINRSLISHNQIAIWTLTIIIWKVWSKFVQGPISISVDKMRRWIPINMWISKQAVCRRSRSYSRGEGGSLYIYCCGKWNSGALTYLKKCQCNFFLIHLLAKL